VQVPGHFIVPVARECAGLRQVTSCLVVVTVTRLSYLFAGCKTNLIVFSKGAAVAIASKKEKSKVIPNQQPESVKIIIQEALTPSA
jgi:hypothetical protein